MVNTKLSRVISILMFVLISTSFISARALVFEKKEVIKEPITINAPTVNAYLNIKVFLEGAMDGPSLMSTDLIDSTFYTSLNTGVLPKTDPYLGTVTVTNLPVNTVDWVLVEIYNQKTGNLVLQSPSILLSDGSITDTTGTNGVDITNIVDKNNKYFIVVRHRNHLAVCSANYEFFKDYTTYNYDFTTGNAYSNSNGQKEVSTGIYAMIAGDGDGNELIQTNDKSGIWSPQAGSYGYLQSDYDLNTFSQTTDKSGYWEYNVGLAAQYDPSISTSFQTNTHTITLTQSSSIKNPENKINPFLRK